MNRATPQPFQAHLAARVKELREAQGLLQDELARRALGSCGLPWSRTTVAQIENGRRDVPLGEILLLPALFHIELGDILCDGTTVEAVPGVYIPDAALRAILEGRALDERYAPRHYGVATRSARKHQAPAVGEADQRAAARLGVEVEIVMAHAERLWGRSLTAERDARVEVRARAAGAASRRALRGHVTRALTEEVAQAIRQSPRRANQ